MKKKTPTETITEHERKTWKKRKNKKRNQTSRRIYRSFFPTSIRYKGTLFPIYVTRSISLATKACSQAREIIQILRNCNPSKNIIFLRLSFGRHFDVYDWTVVTRWTWCWPILNIFNLYKKTVSRSPSLPSPQFFILFIWCSCSGEIYWIRIQFTFTYRIDKRAIGYLLNWWRGPSPHQYQTEFLHWVESHMSCQRTTKRCFVT